MVENMSNSSHFQLFRFTKHLLEIHASKECSLSYTSNSNIIINMAKDVNMIVLSIWNIYLK